MAILGKIKKVVKAIDKKQRISKFKHVVFKLARVIVRLDVNFFYKKTAKKIAQKGIYEFLHKELANIQEGSNVLLVGAGGSLGALVDKYASDRNFKVTSVDIDAERKPDIVADICECEFEESYDYIILPEVLEHFHSPKKAVDNLHNALNKDGKVLFTVPFIFPIHDRPYDYYRYTVYGLEHLFNKYEKQYIKENNNWGETVCVLILRHYNEPYKLRHLVVMLGFMLYPILSLLGRIAKIDNITTSYSGVFKK